MYIICTNLQHKNLRIYLLYLLKHHGESWFHELFTSKSKFFPHWVTVWKLRKCTLTQFWQKFRKTNVFSYHERNYQRADMTNYFMGIFSFFHTAQCGKTSNSLSLKTISSNQLLSNFFCKTIAFTKFLQKKCEREFLQFPHCECGKTEDLLWRALSQKKTSSNQIFSNFFHVAFTNFYQ